MAAGLAADLATRPGTEVNKVPGGFGEFSVLVNQEKVVDTNRFWYPTPAKCGGPSRPGSPNNSVHGFSREL